MKTLTVANAKSIGARTAAPAHFRFRVWHMLFSSILVSLLCWGALFFLIDLAASALR
jgi:hypothetical protein